MRSSSCGVESARGFDQAKVSLVDQLMHGIARSRISPGQRHDEPQVAFDQRPEGRPIALLHLENDLLLFGWTEGTKPCDLVQLQAKAVGGHAVAIGWGS